MTEEEGNGEGSVKFTLSITKSTDEWLAEHYPEGMSQQERVRMAINNARQSRESKD